jgi:uncharacterized membrane protein (DUF485 family)
MTDSAARLDALARARTRVAGALTVAMVTIYFGFILLIAWAKPLMARQVVPGVSLGILSGALVIVASCLLTLIYVYWANRHYDPALKIWRENETSE